VPFAIPIESPPDEVAIARPVRPRIWSVFLLYVAAIAATLIASTVPLVMAGVFRGEAAESAGTLLQDIAARPMLMVSMLFWSMVVLLGITLLGAVASPVPWTQRLRLRAPAMSAGRIASAAVGAIALGLIFSMLYALDLMPRSPTLEALGQSVAGLFGAELGAALLVIGLMPGLSEELLFRGYVQTRLTQRWGAAWSVLITALLFGAYHMDLSQGILAVAMGLYLGVVAERADSVVPVMIAHAANNTTGVLVGRFTGDFNNPAWAWVLLGAGLIILVLCLRHIRRERVMVPPVHLQDGPFGPEVGK